MNTDVQRAVDATFDRYRYQLTDAQLRTLCVAWAAIWGLNTTNAMPCPEALTWQGLREVAAGKRDTDDIILWAFMVDMRAGVIPSGGVVSHIGLARTRADIGALTDIWSKLPPYTGDGIGDVYMASLHR